MVSIGLFPAKFQTLLMTYASDDFWLYLQDWGKIVDRQPKVLLQNLFLRVLCRNPNIELPLCCLAQNGSLEDELELFPLVLRDQGGVRQRLI
jgi:hypothetical protein